MGELMGYIDGLKKSVNETRNIRKSLEVDQSNNRSAVDYRSMDDIQGPSRFAEKSELENLRKEINELREGALKPTSRADRDQFLKDRDNKLLEEKLTEIPKTYLADGMTSELASLKSKVSKMSVAIEALEKTTNKLTDERNAKFGQLEKKVSDDLDSLKLLKERIQIEVDLMKERATQIKASSMLIDQNNQSQMLTNQSHINLPKPEPAKEDASQNAQNKQAIDTLTKVHENFKRETVLNLNQIKATMTAITKRLGLGDKSQANADNPDPKEDHSKEAGNAKDPHKPGDKSKTPAVSMLLDDEKLSKFEDRFYEHEIHVKKLIFDQNKKLIERIDLLSSTLDDMRNRQSRRASPRPGEQRRSHAVHGRWPGKPVQQRRETLRRLPEHGAEERN